MVYVEEDDFARVPERTNTDDKKYFVPALHETHHARSSTSQPVPRARSLSEDNEGCVYEHRHMSRCRRITNPKTCHFTDGCSWDTDFNECSVTPSILNKLKYLVLGLPVVYAVCYYRYSKPKLDEMWKPYRMFHGVYLTSMAMAICAFVYTIYRILYSRTYEHTHARYAGATKTLLVGATITPVALALWASQHSSMYGVLLGLLVTSLGTVWFVYAHLQTNMPFLRKDRVTLAAMYYALFHVIVMDNFVWWWLFFSAAG